MKKQFFVLFFLGFQSAFAQDVKINIGDTIPKIHLKNVIGNPSGISIDNPPKKLIILDFWSQYCSGCISEMPRLDSLQKLFGDLVQIITVTKDKKADVERIFSKRYERSMPLNISMIVEDEILHKLFPHITVPHVVWIDGMGKIKYITSGNNTQKSTIQDFLDGKPLNFSEKKSYPDYDNTKPFWEESTGTLSKYNKYYSAISRYAPGLDAFRFRGETIDGVRLLTFINIKNMPLLSLFKLSCTGLVVSSELSNDNRVQIDVKDPEPFRSEASRSGLIGNDEWLKKYAFGYEALIPPMTVKAAEKFMQNDLERYFPYSAKIEKREKEVYVITLDTNVHKISAKGNKFFAGKSEDGKSYTFEHAKISSLLYFLNSQVNSSIPVVDRTEYKGVFDAKISLPTDLKLLNIQLKEYGLKISQEREFIDMLIIKDKPISNH
ncbi:MAG: TlpA disulfide reductase family protein [Pedobacter sp.]|jgi:thiol-disulfide isomerase/thioredoxin|uniref:TlpA family protein disulfide reductase n=1 Tax=Pedobacter sp. TaxID=1411316 RepID=UPI0035650FAA